MLIRPLFIHIIEVGTKIKSIRTENNIFDDEVIKFALSIKTKKILVKVVPIENRMMGMKILEFSSNIST
ncbi:hypothetical protein D3C80_1880450 [compost metagenome]